MKTFVMKRIGEVGFLEAAGSSGLGFPLFVFR